MSVVNNRKISVILSGNEGNNTVHDTKQSMNFLYIFQGDFSIQEKYTYDSLLNIEVEDEKFIQPILLNFITEDKYKLTPTKGVTPLYGDEGNDYSFLKQEYVEDTSFDPPKIVYRGEWIPVAIKINNNVVVDYNISNGRKYKYIIYPTTLNGTDWKEQYANEGNVIETDWNCWSLTELVPVKSNVQAPNVKQNYIVPTDGVWLFRYDVETGEQVQNFSRSEQQNLSMFPRFSQGKTNYLSGSVSCKLGSEIVPYTESYVERLKSSTTTPLSSNERIDMLKAWRKIIFSKNPKLLKDRKGQSFLVTIVSSSNKPFDAIHNQPDTISFSWTQIGTSDNTIIIGS